MVSLGDFVPDFIENNVGDIATGVIGGPGALLAKKFLLEGDLGEKTGYGRMDPKYHDPNEAAYKAADSADRYDDYITRAQQKAGMLQDRKFLPMNMAAQQADYQNAQGARAQQNALMQSYNQAIAGNAPSVAQAQLQSGLDQANRQTLAMAANSRGGAGNAMALSDAMRQMSNASTDIAGRAAALRAQEIDAARQGGSGLAQAMRGQDLATRASSMDAARMPVEMQMKQFALNDAAAQAERERQLKLMAMQQGVYDRDQRAAMQYQQDLMRGRLEADAAALGYNRDVAAARRGATDKVVGTALNAIGNVATGGMTGGMGGGGGMGGMPMPASPSGLGGAAPAAPAAGGAPFTF